MTVGLYAQSNDVVAAQKVLDKPEIQIRYGLKTESLNGLEQGKFGLPDSTLATLFRAGGHFSVGKGAEKLTVKNSLVAPFFSRFIQLLLLYV